MTRYKTLTFKTAAHGTGGRSWCSAIFKYGSNCAHDARRLHAQTFNGSIIMPASSGGSSTFPTPDEMVVFSQSSESTSGGTCEDSSSSGYQFQACSSGASCRPIRYFNGGMVLSETDISSGGAGMPWSHRRSFMNQMDQNGSLRTRPQISYRTDIGGLWLDRRQCVDARRTYNRRIGTKV